ncbi:hypothetical protein J32TS2_41860 [Shouchella clausii]|nr:hypothetical protein J1TS1_38970 [Shouchella clausii]GIN18830.1 hypothetical protein J32TS2_41860 [Shouchella clausii]
MRNADVCKHDAGPFQQRALPLWSTSNLLHDEIFTPMETKGSFILRHRHFDVDGIL